MGHLLPLPTVHDTHPLTMLLQASLRNKAAKQDLSERAGAWASCVSRVGGVGHAADHVCDGVPSPAALRYVTWCTALPLNRTHTCAPPHPTTHPRPHTAELERSAAAAAASVAALLVDDLNDEVVAVYDTQRLLERESQLLAAELATLTRELASWGSKAQVSARGV